jgi:uncharacterized protein (TIGR03435 family)
LNRISPYITFIVLLSAAAFAQSPAPEYTAFDIADVHAVPYTSQRMQGGVLRNGRYELRHATMLDLIGTAYDVDQGMVFGGPSWLEYDRFDVIAKAPANTSARTIRLMLQSLLAERFKLVVHADTRPVPGFALIAGKSKPKLKEANGAGNQGCQRPPMPGYYSLSCRNISMDELAQALRPIVTASLNPSLSPVVNSTGLEGTWDVDIRWTPSQTGDGAISIFNAIDQQLGLKLEPQQVPTPVIVVDRADEKPSANPADIGASLPPPLPPEFEVASIRPCGQGNLPAIVPQFQPGGRVNTPCFRLGDMIGRAFDPLTQILGGPEYLYSVAYVVVAKAPLDTVTNPSNMPDQNALQLMMRALLVDRFKLAFHYENRPMDAYTLVPSKPKLKPADPSTRTGCKGKLVVDPSEGISSIITCQNVTMAQFAEQLLGLSPDHFHYPVLDATKIVGAWDFTLTTAPSRAGMGSRGGAAPAPPAGGGVQGVASDPAGDVPLFDAIEKQLGLKLEVHKRPEPVVIIDHIEEKPTDN